MEPHLKIEPHRAAGGVLLQLAGVIDETLDQPRLVQGNEGVVVIDLEGVTRITSYGVQAWMGALAMMSTKYLAFVNCHPSIVSRFNMVHGFAGQGQVVSLYLPYACAQCRHTFEKLFDLRRSLPDLSRLSPPAASCPSCGGEAAFDDLPDRYLAHAAAQQLPEPPPLFDVLLAAVHPEAPRGLKVLKQVEGRFTAVWLSGHLDARDHLKRAADDLDGPLLFSMEGVTHFVPEGLGRIVDFLKRAPAEVVLADVPLELAERVAAVPELLAGQRVKLLSLRAPFRCETHGEQRVHFDARAFIDAPPEHAPCPSCARPAARTWEPGAARALGALPTTARTPELDAVLARSAERPEPGVLTPVRALGAGSVAEVSLARQTGPGGVERLVAVKRVLPGIAVDREFVEMFLLEARRAARVSHPNVVQIYDVGSDFVVMEYVPGVDLGTLLRKGASAATPCPARVAARIVADLASGLHAAHLCVDEQGQPQPIVHRDVSPHNVIISSDGRVKVRDFGIAKAADVMTRTPTSVFKGNTPYIAPEMIRGGGPGVITPQIDVFAAGLVLYQLLTGQHPFKRDSELSTFAALAEEQAPPPSARRPDVPAGLDRIVSRALAKDPAARHPGAGALAAELEQFIADTGTPVDASQVAAWVKAVEQPKVGAKA